MIFIKVSGEIVESFVKRFVYLRLIYLRFLLERGREIKFYCRSEGLINSSLYIRTSAKSSFVFAFPIPLAALGVAASANLRNARKPPTLFLEITLRNECCVRTNATGASERGSVGNIVERDRRRFRLRRVIWKNGDRSHKSLVPSRRRTFTG